MNFSYELYGWIYPFINDKFDLSICSTDTALKNWAYKPELKISNEEMSKILAEKASHVRKKYEKYLEKAFDRLKDLK